MKFELKYSKIYSLSIKNIGWPLSKYWFTKVNQFQSWKTLPTKSFSFGNSTISWWKWIKIENQINFESTFPIFFHHNSQKTGHLVRPNNLECDNIFKSPLFIKFKRWLWKLFVLQIFQSKGYPFTKNPLFLIILIKIHQYPWYFISVKNMIFNEISNFFPNFTWIFSFPFFMIFLEKMIKKYNFKKFKKSKSIQKPWKLGVKMFFDSFTKINFQVKIQISWPKKSIFQGKLKKKTGQPFGDIHMMKFAVNFLILLKTIRRPLNYEDLDFEILHV